MLKRILSDWIQPTELKLALSKDSRGVQMSFFMSISKTLTRQIIQLVTDEIKTKPTRLWVSRKLLSHHGIKIPASGFL